MKNDFPHSKTAAEVERALATATNLIKDGYGPHHHIIVDALNSVSATVFALRRIESVLANAS